jgi:hypothetical protein
MSNRFLRKVAGMAEAKVPAPRASLVAKVGLGASLAGLGIGAANYVNNQQSRVLEQQRLRLERERVRLQEEQRRLDEKSLRALGSINKALKTTRPFSGTI